MDSIKVRRALKSDIPRICEIHTASFPDFFLTKLGQPFLEGYYQVVLSYADGILLVAEGPSGEPWGFVAGFVEPHAFYAHLKVRRLRFILRALPAIIRSPSLVRRILINASRVAAKASSATELPPKGVCELSSVAVSPIGQGRGYGGILVKAFSETARNAGAHSIILSTDASNNIAVNEFYRRLGFVQTGQSAHSDGRQMNEYTLQL